MSGYEYAVVPAPKQGLKARGVKTTEDRFALAIQTIMNEYGAAGWEYQRTDTLPCEERQGFTGRSTTFQNMLVFRKPLVVAETAAPSMAIAAPVAAPSVQPVKAPDPVSVNLPAFESGRVRTVQTIAPHQPAMRLENRPLEIDPERPEPRVAAE